MNLDLKKVNQVVRDELAEDIGDGDITALNLIPPTLKISAKILAGESCVISGLAVARQVFKLMNSKCTWRAKYKDGASVKKGRVVATVTGLARAVLTGERTALNFLSHMSGISTLTDRFVEKIKNTKAKIFDTRKTHPGLRMLDKYAVTCGGGFNHRMGLYDMVLIKDNHIKLCQYMNIPLAQLIWSMLGKIPYGTKVELEAKNIAEVNLGLNSKVDIIMLDNMKYKSLRKVMKLITKSKKSVEVEVSGRVNLKNAGKIARLGVDRISIGEITHSAKAIDFSLDIIS